MKTESKTSQHLTAALNAKNTVDYAHHLAMVALYRRLAAQV